MLTSYRGSQHYAGTRASRLECNPKSTTEVTIHRTEIMIPRNANQAIAHMLRRLARRTKDFVKYLQWRCVKNAHESVYFYTFHKCASSLFGSYALKKFKGLRHVDYEDQIYHGKKREKFVFEEKGFIYGPLRLSVPPGWGQYSKFTESVSRKSFVSDKIAIFMVRDPRDIIVSAYYSFGYTHGFSPVQQFREQQKRYRARLQNLSVDDYALDIAPWTLAYFDRLDKLSNVCERSVVLKFEDMIDNWSLFAERLTKYCSIEERVLTDLYRRSRPQEKEDFSSHRRSGRPGAFRNQLKKETIVSLNNTLKEVLKRFRYKM